MASHIVHGTDKRLPNTAFNNTRNPQAVVSGRRKFIQNFAHLVERSRQNVKPPGGDISSFRCLHLKGNLLCVYLIQQHHHYHHEGRGVLEVVRLLSTCKFEKHVVRNEGGLLKFIYSDRKITLSQTIHTPQAPSDASPLSMHAV